MAKSNTMNSEDVASNKDKATRDNSTTTEDDNSTIKTENDKTTAADKMIKVLKEVVEKTNQETMQKVIEVLERLTSMEEKLDHLVEQQPEEEEEDVAPPQSTKRKLTPIPEMDFDGMKRDELVAECKKRGLKASGRKMELKQRLLDDVHTATPAGPCTKKRRISDESDDEGGATKRRRRTAKRIR